jgi:hypothetical protein
MYKQDEVLAKVKLMLDLNFPLEESGGLGRYEVSYDMYPGDITLKIIESDTKVSTSLNAIYIFDKELYTQAQFVYRKQLSERNNELIDLFLEFKRV